MSDLGGDDNVSEAERSLVRRASMLELQCELLEQRFAQAEGGAATSAQLADYQRTAGTLRRLLTSLGLQRRARDVGPIGPRYIGLRLACSKALERFLALMGRHLARASEANAALLGSLAALAGPGGPRAENAANFFRSSARGLPRTSAIRRFLSSPLSACAGALSGGLISKADATSALIEENVWVRATPFLVALLVLSNDNAKAHARAPIAVLAGYAKS